MFIYNIKISGSKLFKVFIAIVAICVVLLFGFSVYKIYNGMTNKSIDSCVKNGSINEILPKNYTNILKSVHDNLNNYVGKQIKFSGYVYRAYDFNEDQFVLARNMVISSDYQTLIVGFLCNSNKAKKFEDGKWVEIIGEITKSDYHGEIPEIKVIQINEVHKPNDEYVYPPEDSYVPTCNVF